MIDKCNQQLLNKQLCNAFDCCNEAVHKLDVTAGKYGTIQLDLCENCIKLFQKEK